MTDSESKTWITTKLPQSTLDDARADPRTQYRIMEDGLRFQQSTLKRFDQLRDAATGNELPGQNSDAFLSALLDVWEKADVDVVDVAGLERETSDPLSRREVRQELRRALREELPSGVFRQ